MNSVNKIRPYFIEDIEAQLRSTYLATIAGGIESARVIFLLCVAYDIPPVWMKPEHIQVFQKEYR